MTDERTVLSCHDLSYAVRDCVLLKGINLKVRAGETLGIVGPNGSGKSTLIKLLANLRPASQGQVLLNGQPLRAMARRCIAQQLAVVEQQADTHDALSVFDAVALGRHLGCRRCAPGRSKTLPSSSKRCAMWMLATCASGFGAIFRAASVSAFTLPGPWPSARTFCCWTNPPTIWTSCINCLF